MILQGRTPRALTFTSLALVAGIALLLVPLFFVRARSAHIAAQQNQQQGNRNQRDQGGQNAPGGRDARVDVQRLQAEIQRRQAELQARMQELQQMMRQLEQIQGGNRGGQGGPPPGAGGGQPGAPGGPGGQPGRGGPGGGGNPGGRPPMPNDFPPMGHFGPPPMPGGGPPPGFPPGFGPQGGNIDQRLQQVERKLDTLINEIRQMRGGQNRKGPQPQPRRDANVPAPAVVPPVPGGGLPSPIAPPQPPQPPRRPGNTDGDPAQP